MEEHSICMQYLSLASAVSAMLTFFYDSLSYRKHTSDSCEWMYALTLSWACSVTVEGKSVVASMCFYQASFDFLILAFPLKQ